MSNRRVAIVGGGLSGIYAAWLLEKLHIDYIVLEARANLGGRILSSTANLLGPCFDLGPTWFWPALQPEMSRLVNELGVATFAQYEKGDALVERTRSGHVNRVRNFESAPTSRRVAGGMSSLVDSLSAGLPVEKIRTGHVVTNIRLGATGIRILSLDEQQTFHAFDVSHVLIAVPPRLAAQTIVFEPPLSASVRTRWNHTATWMAPHAKYVAQYSEPFWREAGLSGAAQSSIGPLVEIHDASAADGSPALFGFVGIPAQVRRSAGETALLTHCRAQLVRLFGQAAANPQAEFFKDWARDPLTATEGDQIADSHPVPAGSLQPDGEWGRRMLLAVSEASMRYPGYLAGAVDAAEWSVAELREQLKG